MRASHGMQVVVAVLVLAWSTATCPTRAAEPAFRALDFQPNAVSADGNVVVGVRFQISGGGEAVRWTAAGGAVGLGHLAHPGFSVSTSNANGLSADGSVVVGYQDNFGPQQTEAFHWTGETGMTSLGHLPGFTSSHAISVSADGSVIVGSSAIYGSSSDHWPSEPFRWTVGSGLVGLGHLPGHSHSRAAATSADGSVIAGVSRRPGGYSTAFRWTAEGGIVALGALPGHESIEPAGVSADGSTIVGTAYVDYSGSEPDAFRWTATDGVVSLDDSLAWIRTAAVGVSGDGSVIVGNGLHDSGLVDPEDGSTLYNFTPFIWDEVHGMRSLRDVLIDQGLDLAGWPFMTLAISDDGSAIVGYGTYGTGPSAHNEGWIATIPDPATLPLLGLACLLLGRPRHAKDQRSPPRQITSLLHVALTAIIFVSFDPRARVSAAEYSILSDPADFEPGADAPGPDAAFLRVGATPSYNLPTANGALMFTLPALAPNERVVGAQLSLMQFADPNGLAQVVQELERHGKVELAFEYFGGKLAADAMFAGLTAAGAKDLNGVSFEWVDGAYADTTQPDVLIDLWRMPGVGHVGLGGGTGGPGGGVGVEASTSIAMVSRASSAAGAGPNVDVWAIGLQNGASAGTDTYFFRGDGPDSNPGMGGIGVPRVKIENDLLSFAQISVFENTRRRLSDEGSSALADYINLLYDNYDQGNSYGLVPGTSKLILRLNDDDAGFEFEGRRFWFGSGNAASQETCMPTAGELPRYCLSIPVLTLTTVPEPTLSVLLILPGLAAMRALRCRRDGAVPRVCYSDSDAG